MSSAQQGSSGGDCDCTSKKTERTRRTWTPKEEIVLLEAMKDLVANGWKSDNSFRAGYLNKLEVAMKRDNPNSDLKSTPHILSKVTSWKKHYNSLNTILDRSGVGFNLRGNYMIDCEDDLWAQLDKVDANALSMRYKMWPYYESWKYLFGNDRATGKNVDVQEAWQDYLKDDEELPKFGSAANDNDTSFDNELNTEAYDQISQSARDDLHAKRDGKKRKINGEMQGICELLSEMNNDTNSRLDHLASRIGHDIDMGNARNETFDRLEEIPGLSLENRFIVCELIAFKAERLDIWRGMKEETRAQYVEHLLKTKGA